MRKQWKKQRKGAMRQNRKSTKRLPLRSLPGQRGFAPLGYKQAVRLRYMENIQVNPTIGQANDYVFSANGLYDPNITGIGHQPYGFDQMMAMFNHYTVIGSKITVRTVSNNQSAVSGYSLGICLRDGSANIGGGDTNALIEQPGNVFKLVPSGTGLPTTVISKTFSSKMFFTKSKQAIVEDANLRGDASNNPAEGAFYHVIVGPTYSGDDLGQQAYQVIIDYYAIFTEPKMLGQS